MFEGTDGKRGKKREMKLIRKEMVSQLSSLVDVLSLDDGRKQTPSVTKVQGPPIAFGAEDPNYEVNSEQSDGTSGFENDESELEDEEPVDGLQQQVIGTAHQIISQVEKQQQMADQSDMDDEGEEESDSVLEMLDP